MWCEIFSVMAPISEFALITLTQTVQDGTGRVVELAKDFVANEPFVLSYGDILVDAENYLRLADLPNETAAIVSVKYDEDCSKGGAVFVNDDSN